MRVFVVALAIATIAGCGGGGDATPTPSTVTVTVTAPAPPTNPPGTPQATKTVEVTRTSEAAKVETGLVPNVVGMNHQLAQDTMQAAGFYYLTEEDATGAGRLLIVDRNWVVVSQSPAPGKRMATDTKITLRSKKIGE